MSMFDCLRFAHEYELTYIYCHLLRTSALETALDEHSDDPVLSRVHNPTLLGRRDSLAADIAYFLEATTDTWYSHPTHLAFQDDLPQAISTYVSRIRAISSSAQPALLLAHAYVRYLGDLSGGQFVRHKIMKAYGLDESGDGARFYDFGTLGGAAMKEGERGGIGELKKIKEWYREGMDRGVGDNEQLKGEASYRTCNSKSYF